MATSRYSKPTSKPKFNKHHVYEVATSLTESKQIANDYAENNRYAYRATAYVVGDCRIRPYDPVYIDGVPNGLSGYWTVLAVKHVFGGSDAPYMMELHLGTDTLGDVNPNAQFTSEQRNINNELAGQDLTNANSRLLDYSPNVNQNAYEVPKVVLSPVVQNPVSNITTSTTNPYYHATSVPNFGVVTRTTSWSAQKGNKII